LGKRVNSEINGQERARQAITGDLRKRSDPMWWVTRALNPGNPFSPFKNNNNNNKIKQLAASELLGESLRPDIDLRPFPAFPLVHVCTFWEFHQSDAFKISARK
jgi:hypothetical protein